MHSSSQYVPQINYDQQYFELEITYIVQVLIIGIRTYSLNLYSSFVSIAGSVSSSRGTPDPLGSMHQLAQYVIGVFDCVLLRVHLRLHIIACAFITVCSSRINAHSRKSRYAAVRYPYQNRVALSSPFSASVFLDIFLLGMFTDSRSIFVISRSDTATSCPPTRCGLFCTCSTTS